MIFDDWSRLSDNMRRYELVAQLEKLGPRLSTSVVVNGRALLLDAAIRLVEQLPDEARMARRGVHIFIDPDPFAHTPAPAVETTRGVSSEEHAGMMARLIERQDETDRLAEQERRGQSWWRRIGRLMINSP